MEIQQFNHLPIAGDDLPHGAFIPHSRFDTVINFVNNQNQIAYITSNEDILASNAIYLPDVKLNEIDSLTISFETIALDDISFERDMMDIYNSNFHFNGVDLNIFESRLLQIPAENPNLFPEKSLVFLLNPAFDKFFISGFDKQFLRNAKKSRKLILSGEIVRGIETIRGTGYGLTPSGDDFIAGFLLGLHFCECKYKVDLSVLRNKIYHSAIGNNLLTNSLLLNAKNRKYFKPLKKILLLLCDAMHSPTGEALEQILSIGATSGADFITGYILPINHKIGI